ncbi:general odorant-binding protein 67 [Aedes albopictus]|uniref:OBP47-like domain-containing protein n=1 Tax=Aedes albopictus TaxID=7160 RepID=A0ABM1YJ26_AEDAL|nr:general odorant-binding protein 67-like [Aedes albopictus]
MVGYSFLFICILIVSTIYSQPPPDDKACFQGNKVDANGCCELPRFVAREINTKCDEKYKPLSPRLPPGIQPYEGSCVIECLFNTTGMFKDGKLLQDKIQQQLKKTIGADKNFAPLLNGVVADCYRYVMDNPANSFKPLPMTPGRPGCSFIPQAYMNCIKSELFENCPKANWTAADGCDLLKQKLNVGCSYYSIMIGVKGLKS